MTTDQVTLNITRHQADAIALLINERLHAHLEILATLGDDKMRGDMVTFYNELRLTVESALLEPLF